MEARARVVLEAGIGGVLCLWSGVVGRHSSSRSRMRCVHSSWGTWLVRRKWNRETEPPLTEHGRGG